MLFNEIETYELDERLEFGVAIGDIYICCDTK